jgi:acetamidase/formamidase
MKWGVRSASVLAVIVAAGLYAGAQTPKQQKKSSTPEGKHYTLPATKENVQWGWLDPTEKPRLTINSGDTVSVETWYHALDAIKPAPTDHTIAGPPMDELARLRKANPGGGPHSITGPIYVEGAEPGDTLEIRILKIMPKDYGQNFNLPGKEFPTVGLLAPEFPEGFVRYYKLDLVKKQAEFKPGITIDLQPYPGILAVGRLSKTPRGAPARCALGRTAPTWTCTNCRQARPFTCRSF